MSARTSDHPAERMLAILDRAEEASDLDSLVSMVDDAGDPAPAAALRRLTQVELPPADALRTLKEAVAHRGQLRESLGRDPGFRLALFDLLISIKGRVLSPKLIELPVFEGIQRSAMTDHLTGLTNRSYLESRLENEIRRARRYGEHLSLLLLDLDDFKEVNDTRGHLVGDRVLREVGRLILRTVRDVDIAARYGGEEFLVVLPETPRNGALVVAERIRLEIERHFRRRKGDSPLRLTLSGGLACYPEDAEEPASLLEKADLALYRAKGNGKNSIEVFFEEKRRASRITVEEHRVRASLRGELHQEPFRSTGTVKNISEGGLLVELAEPLPVGSRLQVSFSLGRENAYSFPTTVVRVEPAATEGKRRRYDAGLRFQRRARVLQPALSRLARQQLAAG